MKIMITGATGFIGFNLAQKLASDGHKIVATARRAEDWQTRIPAWEWRSCDFSHDTQAEQWAARVADVDMVINAVGIISEDGKQSFERIQTLAPQALFTACSQAGVKVIQISAMGADQPDIAIPFLRTKQHADDHLWQLPGECIVIYPSVVIGQGGSSTELFCKLSALPIIPLPGHGQQTMNPVHIDDLCAAVSHMILHWTGGKQRHQITGATTLTLRELYSLLRDWMHFGKARFFPVPMSLLQFFSRMAEVLKLGGLLNTSTLDMLENSSTPPHTYPAAPPRPLTEALWSRPATQADSWFAIMKSIQPVLFASIMLIWIVTGLVSAFWNVPGSYALLATAGVHGPLATLGIFGGAIFDTGIGLLMLTGWQRRKVYALQIGMMLTYMLIISLIIPLAWLDPLGPVTKNLPMLAATWLLLALEPRQGRNT